MNTSLTAEGVPPADHLAVVFTNCEVAHRTHQRRLGVFSRLRGQRLVAGGSVVDPHLVMAHRAVRWPVVERRRRGGGQRPDVPGQVVRRVVLLADDPVDDHGCGAVAEREVRRPCQLEGTGAVFVAPPPQANGVQFSGLFSQNVRGEIACQALALLDTVIGPRRVGGDGIHPVAADSPLPVGISSSTSSGHLVSVLGHRRGQHGQDLCDVGAARAQHQAQVESSPSWRATQHQIR